MRVLVTGHNGYIGSVLAATLESAGHDVVGLDSYLFEQCTFEPDRPPVASWRKDIRDAANGDLAGFDAVAHLAALCNDPLGNLNPRWTDEINYQASLRLARAAKHAGVRRFLYASSCSLYGNAGGDDLLDEHAPMAPLTPYALSKARTEEGLARLADDHFSPVFMRCATAYGVSPRLRADVVLNNMACWAYTAGTVRITSDGTPWRPVVHVRDIAAAFTAVLGAPRAVVHNEAFNIGVNEENYQVKDLADIVAAAIPGCAIEYAEGGGPDPRSYRVDFTKFAERFPGVLQWDARRGVGELYAALQRVGLSAAEFHGPRYTRVAYLQLLLDSGRLDDTLRWTAAAARG